MKSYAICIFDTIPESNPFRPVHGLEASISRLLADQKGSCHVNLIYIDVCYPAL